MKAILFLASLQIVAAISYAQSNVDPTFNPTFPTNSSVYAIVSLPGDGLLIGGDFEQVAGQRRSSFARLTATGAVDPILSPLAVGAGGPFPSVVAIATNANGQIFVGGTFTYFNEKPRGGIARLNSDGSLDTTFDPGSGFANALRPECGVFSIAVQNDGKIIVNGWFTSFNGIARFRLARLQSDGKLDLTFDPGSGPSNRPNGEGDISSILLWPSDGSVLVGGSFSSFALQPRNGLLSLLGDGSINSSFNPALGDPFAAQALAEHNGGVLVATSLITQTLTNMGGILRLNSSGNLDDSFHATNISGVYNLLVQPDGKIIAGSINGIERRNADGSPDFVLADSVFASALALDSEGRIVIGGFFTSVNGVRRIGIARLFPLPMAPTLQNPQISNGSFSVNVSTLAGKKYFLESKPSLSESNWTSNPSIAGDGQNKTLTDPLANLRSRFYRLRQE